MKNLISLILSVMLASSFFVVRAADSDITVKINGETIAMNQPPIIQNNRTLVPIRTLSEAMKFDVDWDSSSQLVSISDMSKTLKLRIGNNVVNRSYKYRTNEENITIDVPAAIYNDYTYVPLRSVSELFGAEVEWEQETHTADIKYLNTYGKIIDFEDEGMEKLCRLSVSTGYNIDISEIVGAEFLRNEGDAAQKDWIELRGNDPYKWDEKWWEIYEKYFDSIYDDGNISIYDGPFYEGMALQITQLGLSDNLLIPDWIDIHSLNDIKYLPNVKILGLQSCKNLSDISGLNYNKSYEEIDLLFCPIYNFDVLNDIVVEKYIQIDSMLSGCFNYNPDTESYQSFAKRFSELYSKIRSVYNKIISDDMSDYEKAKAIHDWIIEHTEYDYESYLDIGNAPPQAHSYVGVFLDGKAVCQGYQETFQLLCDMAGLKCCCVSGTGNGEAHGWNIVKIDNSYYHVDTTWDDTANAGYTYFLKSDEFMNQNHSWEETSYHDTYSNFRDSLPACPKSYNE